MPRITKQMQELRKSREPKKQKDERQRLCVNCIHATPYTRGHLRNSDGAPIMCSCRFQKHLMLLRHDVCENHEFDLL